MNSEHTDYGWLFKTQEEEISGDIAIDLEHLPPELKQIALLMILNQIDRDTAKKKLTELIQPLEFDITAVELSAYLFKPGYA
ncbi:hypothetical protein ABJ713_004673 [Escherichia coli]